jgi:hypothetical protein
MPRRSDDLDDARIDRDTDVDVDPAAGQAAYDQWAAIAGEPVPHEAAPFEGILNV